MAVHEKKAHHRVIAPTNRVFPFQAETALALASTAERDDVVNTLPGTTRKKAWLAFQLSAGILACCASVPMATAGDPTEAALNELKPVITSIIQLLEKRRYEELFWRYADPDVVKKTEETGTIGGDSMPEWAEKFAADKGPRLLDALRSIREDQPVFDAGGTEATYEVGRPVLGSKTSIVFIKYKKGWYLRNY